MLCVTLGLAFALAPAPAKGTPADALLQVAAASSNSMVHVEVGASGGAVGGA